MSWGGENGGFAGSEGKSQYGLQGQSHRDLWEEMVGWRGYVSQGQ